MKAIKSLIIACALVSLPMAGFSAHNSSEKEGEKHHTKHGKKCHDKKCHGKKCTPKKK